MQFIKAISFLAILLFFTGIQAAEALKFEVYLDDRKIGYHSVVVKQQGSETLVNVNADFEVKFLMIPVFSYQHQASERWVDGCIVELDTRTDKDGEKLFVTAEKQESGLLIKSSQTEKSLSECVKTFAYWDPDLLDSQHLLNTQNGDYEQTSLLLQGQSSLMFKDKAYGQIHKQLKITDKPAIDLFYGADDSWQALQTEVAGGRILRYIRMDNSS